MMDWVCVKDRLPEIGKMVWCAIYTTDIVISQPGEDMLHAMIRANTEAAKKPRVEIGYYSEEGWCTYDGWPMICGPEYWMPVVVPMPPKMEVEE